MREGRLLMIFFCLALTLVGMGWLEAWPIAALAAVMFYGFYRWLWLEPLLWFSVIFAVLTIALLATVLAPIGNLLLAFLALLVGLVFAGWEAAVGISVGWQAWKAQRVRRIVQKQK